MAAKLAKKKKEKENTGKIITENFLEYLTAFWGVLLCLVIPFYMKDGYYKIGEAKYDAYAHLVVFGMPVLLLLVLLYFVFALRHKKTDKEQLRAVGKSFSVTDYFVLAYLAAVLVSYFLCVDFKTAFWGYEGWYMGLFSQLSFVLLYFICSRFLKDYQVVLGALLIMAFYVFVMGILHRLLIDPIGVYENLADYYIQQFLSTLGQASWYSSFLCTVLPAGMFCYWYFQSTAGRIAAGIFTFTGFATLVTQNTDSAYFAFLAAMLVFFWVSVEDAGRMRRLCELAFLFTLAPKFMQLMLLIHPNRTLKLDTISNTLVFDNRIWVLVILCLLLVILFAVLEKKENYPVSRMKIFRKWVFILIPVLLLVWVVILVLGAKGMLPQSLIPVTEKFSYLVWNDRWGNGRGFTWRFTAEMIKEMSPLRKLFGVGPDCYSSYGYSLYEESLKAMWGNSVLTNAHNEWLNSVVNYGIFGAVVYLGIFISALVRFVKNFEKTPVTLGFAACVAAYMAHNMFCYQQVLCTPYVFLFIALAEYQIRKKTKI